MHRTQPPLRGRAWKLLLLLVVLSSGCFALLVEDLVLYRPAVYPEGFWDAPERLDLAIDDCFFQSADGVELHAWYLPPPGRHDPVVLFCHGNAGNLTYRAMFVKHFQERGIGLFLFDYRGFGRSQGSPDEEGLYRDGEAAFRYVTEELGISLDRLVLLGRSLGGGVAAHLAETHPSVAGLVLESTFTSVPDLAGELVPLMPGELLVTSRFDNLARVAGLKMPLLVIHGTEDEVIPVEHGLALHEAAPERLHKEIYLVADGRHGAWLQAGDDYYEVLERFLRNVVRPASRQLRDSPALPGPP